MKKPNWREWNHTPKVSVWQACALSLDIDPHSLQYSDNNDCGYIEGPSGARFFTKEELREEAAKETAREEYSLRLRVLSANLSNRVFFSVGTSSIQRPYSSEVRLSEFAAWAVSVMQWPNLPPELITLARKPTDEPEQTDAPASAGNVAPAKVGGGDTSSRNEKSKLHTDRPWLIADPTDPVPEQLWYVAARYFARQLVIGDSTLLTKRSQLAGKVATSLSNANIKKRGGKKALDPATVLKAFSNVNLG